MKNTIQKHIYFYGDTVKRAEKIAKKIKRDNGRTDGKFSSFVREAVEEKIERNEIGKH